MEPKNLILKLLARERGGIMDNLLRARSKFHNLTFDEMHKPYGAGKETPQQILKNYEKQLRDVDESTTWLKGG